MNNKCRCYINVKHYARQANKGGNMSGYLPCPIHENEEEKVEDIGLVIPYDLMCQNCGGDNLIPDPAGYMDYHLKGWGCLDCQGLG